MSKRGVGAIFTGGASTRMGGHPKGLLKAPSGKPIVAHLASLLDAAGLEVVLAGAQPAYEHLAITMLEDDEHGVGPLGGLCAALRHAGDRALVTVACDMPHVDASLLERLLSHAPGAPLVVASVGGRRQPFLARHSPRVVLPLAREALSTGRRSLQHVLDLAGAVEMALADDEAGRVRDWDTWEDVGSGP